MAAGLTKCFIDSFQLVRNITGIQNLTAGEKTAANNARLIREVVKDYIRKRKSGERKSQVADGVDLLSLFQSRPDVFTEELIIDEILDFFSAAIATT